MSTEEKKGFTYILKNSITGEFYVGSTSDFHGRSWRHQNYLIKGIHYNKRLQDAYDRNPNFDFLIIFEGTREQAYLKEQELLDCNYNNINLLNISIDAKASYRGRLHTDETKKKISESRKNVILPPWTDQQRLNQSIAQTGRKHSQETIEKCRISKLGNKHSEKTRLKMSISQQERFKNNSVSIETRQKQSQKRLGVSRPLHVIEAMKQANSKPITYEGINYPSVVSLIEISEFSRSTTKKLLKRYLEDGSKDIIIKHIITCNFCDSFIKEELISFDPCRFQLLSQRDCKQYQNLSGNNYQGIWYDNNSLCLGCI